MSTRRAAEKNYDGLTFFSRNSPWPYRIRVICPSVHYYRILKPRANGFLNSPAVFTVESLDVTFWTDRQCDNISERMMVNDYLFVLVGRRCQC